MSSDNKDDAGRGPLVSGSQRRPGHAHTRFLNLSRGVNIWQQVKNIVVEVSSYQLPIGYTLKLSTPHELGGLECQLNVSTGTGSP